MTLAEWLERRQPPPPPHLVAGIHRALAGHLADPVSAAPAVLLRVARARLRDLVRGSSTGRDVAFDLLTVDALVTYAFQAAAENPAALHALAQDSLTQLSEIAPA